MATQNGTQYVRGIFQQSGSFQLPAKMTSPWFNKVRIVPTTKATINERRKIGRCLTAHRKHLMVMPPSSAPLDAGSLNPKYQPFFGVRPHRPHVFNAPPFRRLLSKASPIFESPLEHPDFRLCSRLASAILGAWQNRCQRILFESCAQRFPLNSSVPAILVKTPKGNLYLITQDVSGRTNGRKAHSICRTFGSR